MAFGTKRENRAAAPTAACALCACDAGAAALLIGGAVWLGTASLALGTAGGDRGFAGKGLRRLGIAWSARSLARRSRSVVMRLALAAIGAPRAETTQVVLALGLA